MLCKKSGGCCACVARQLCYSRAMFLYGFFWVRGLSPFYWKDYLRWSLNLFVNWFLPVTKLSIKSVYQLPIIFFFKKRQIKDSVFYDCLWMSYQCFQNVQHKYRCKLASASALMLIQIFACFCLHFSSQINYESKI